MLHLHKNLIQVGICRLDVQYQQNEHGITCSAMISYYNYKQQNV